MSVETHVERLNQKHALLEQAIQSEVRRPSPDQPTISELKRQKLKVKEAITRLAH